MEDTTVVVVIRLPSGNEFTDVLQSVLKMQELQPPPSPLPSPPPENHHTVDACGCRHDACTCKNQHNVDARECRHRKNHQTIDACGCRHGACTCKNHHTLSMPAIAETTTLSMPATADMMPALVKTTTLSMHAGAGMREPPHSRCLRTQAECLRL